MAMTFTTHAESRGHKDATVSVKNNGGVNFVQLYKTILECSWDSSKTSQPWLTISKRISGLMKINVVFYVFPSLISIIVHSITAQC